MVSVVYAASGGTSGKSAVRPAKRLFRLGRRHMYRFAQGLFVFPVVMVCTLILWAQDVDTSRSEMRATIERYTADRVSLNRSSPIDFSPARSARMKEFYTEWLSALDRVNFDSMGQDGRVDYLLLKNQLNYELRQLGARVKNFAETTTLLPFAQTIIDLEESRRRMDSMDSSK